MYVSFRERFSKFHCYKAGSLLDIVPLPLSILRQQPTYWMITRRDELDGGGWSYKGARTPVPIRLKTGRA